MKEKPVISHIKLNDIGKFTFEGEETTLNPESPSEYYVFLADQIDRCRKESTEYLKSKSNDPATK